jgi:hypothetical protein
MGRPRKLLAAARRVNQNRRSTNPIEKLLEPEDDSKTFSQLLAEGVPHKGGLGQLASAERTSSVKLLAELIEANERKDPALAAKQARLIEKLKEK